MKQKKVSTYIPDENDSVRSYITSFVHLQPVAVGQSSRSQKHKNKMILKVLCISFFDFKLRFQRIKSYSNFQYFYK